MNPQQQLYFDQARSDFDIFKFLHEQPECHQLHYLQMCTEKLAKAYFYSRTPPPALSHKVFVHFLDDLPLDRRTKIWESLGFKSRRAFQSFLRSIRSIAEQVEKLAPTHYLAGDGPNPEYPWPRPPNLPTMAPVYYRFPLWKELVGTSQGRGFVSFLGKLIAIFPTRY